MGHRLDDRATVSALTLPEGKTDFTYWDATLKGFGLRLRIGHDGKLFRRFLVMYRVDGKQRMKIIENPPGKVLTEKAAREIAITMLGKVHEGKDPVPKKNAACAELGYTFASVVEKYIDAEKGTWSASSRYQKNLYLKDDYFKPLHSRLVSSITRKDIAPLIRAIRTTHSDNTAKQARTHLSSFFSWALAEAYGDQDVNPVIDTSEPKGNDARERALRPDELKAIWDACEGAGEYGKIIRLLILTGCRREEIGELRQSWFAPDMTSFKIPHTKNGKAHTVFVTPMMRAIIDTVPRVVGRDSLFGVRGEKGFTQWGDKYKLGDGCDYWQVRDLRRTMRTGLGKLKVPPHIAELVVNHKKKKLVATYDTYTYEDEIADAFARWSNHVVGIVSDGKVVPLRAS